MEWYKEDFIVSDDKERINFEDVSKLLSTTYWASNRELEPLKKALTTLYHSGCIITENK
ncbi:hypothetical protein [Bacillus sp. AK128]